MGSSSVVSIIKIANIVPHKLDNLLLFLELTGQANVEQIDFQ